VPHADDDDDDDDDDAAHVVDNRTAMFSDTIEMPMSLSVSLFIV